MAKDKLKSEVASSRPRDEKGHFISIPDVNSAKTPLGKFLASHTGNYKNEDDLLEIHIGNPLRRVIVLLEDIKKQKAFSFTVKGSLGIAGVALVISVFGLFGGNQIICDKGSQTLVGDIRVLNAREIYDRPVPVISYFLELVAPPVKQIKKRTILLKTDNNTVYLPYSEEVNYSDYNGLRVLVTGNFNSCNQSLAVDSPDSIEPIY
jgi:hypothetical protein